jgi:NitT/TauT family transport system ATP-binding protein
VRIRAGQASRPAPTSTPGAGRARPTSIEIEGLAKVFRRGDIETHALDDVDVQVASGEFLAVVGPSGCGKSTLLRLIAGLIPPSAGRVTIDGRSVSGPETQLGIVFQKPILLEWRTVLGNVLLQAEMRRLDANAYLERAHRLLSAVGLGDFEDRYPHELSGGMQQRAAIVRALIHDPPLLLMDEPFGALDALTREQMRIDLEELWLSTQKTVVFITHSIDEAVLLADRVMVMSPRPGRIERIIDVDLVRPRGLEARALAKFDEAVAAITEIFLARGVLHSGARGPKLLHTEEA